MGRRFLRLKLWSNSKIPEIYRNQLGLPAITDPSTGKPTPLQGGATKLVEGHCVGNHLQRTKSAASPPAALTGRLSAYYLDTTWEARLPAFRTQSDPNIYQRRTDGAAVLDGYPIVWTDVLTPYGTAAAPDLPLAVFGALSFWWFGEHGSLRLDTSKHAFFANDQLAVRSIEEIDFDYAPSNATAALLTAAV